VIDDNPFDELDLEDALVVDALMGWDGVTCAVCGAPLATDPEDELDGDAARPICGGCSRARDADVEDRSAAGELHAIEG
jgi:hypothetical protein